jgi:hypothetical protein
VMEIESGACGVCISGSADGDMPEFSSSQEVKARKDHKCCECGDVIPRGTVYERFSGKWDGTVQTYRTCLACAEIRASLCCDGWTYTMLWEDAADSQLFDHLTTGCLDQLTTAAAKAKLLDKWREWKGL